MQELKKILLQRIQNIFELQEIIINDEKGELTYEAKYEAMIDQKRSQKIRTIKENQILLSLNSQSLQQTSRIEELYEVTVAVCSAYDLQFAKYQNVFTVSMRENLRKLYCDFFNSHGFKQKTKQVNQAFEKPINAISPAMLLGWLSQWSKKIYCEMLQKEIQVSFQTKQRKERISKVSHSGITLNRKKSNIIANQIIEQSDLSNAPLNGRANIYGFFQQELYGYYKFLNLEGVDVSYLKTIKKRFKKEDLLRPAFLNKASETLIQLPGQRQISKIMKSYLEDFYQKYPKSRERQQQIKAKSQTPMKSPVSPEKKKQRNITESENDLNFNGSKLLAPKMSQFQFFKPEQIELKIKKLKLINHKTLKNNLQFPEIRRNSQQIYNKLNLSNNAASHQMEKSRSREKLSVSCLDKQIKEKNFLKCQGFNSKMSLKQDVQNFEDMIYGDRLDSPVKMKKILSDSLGREYDDRKIKATKNFDLGDLKIHHRIPSIKARFYGNGKP